MGHEEDAKKYVEAARQARIELEKQGTPDYDPRTHQRLVEAERKLAEKLHEEQEDDAAS